MIAFNARLTHAKGLPTQNGDRSTLYSITLFLFSQILRKCVHIDELDMATDDDQKCEENTNKFYFDP